MLQFLIPNLPNINLSFNAIENLKILFVCFVSNDINIWLVQLSEVFANRPEIVQVPFVMIVDFYIEVETHYFVAFVAGLLFFLVETPPPIDAADIFLDVFDHFDFLLLENLFEFFEFELPDNPVLSFFVLECLFLLKDIMTMIV